MPSNEPPWTCAQPLSPSLYASVARRAMLECFKWHTQADDQPVICSFPLVLKKAAWKQVVTLASLLAKETLAAEQELRKRVDLHFQLGLPRALRKCLRAPRVAPKSAAVRIMRFDFHWTHDGWRISEANTDVAGGFIEASGVTDLFAQEYPEFEPAGDPAGALAQAARDVVGAGKVVGLMHLPMYSEDRQIMLYLAGRFEEAGLTACLFSPEQLRWQEEKAAVDCAWRQGPIDLLFRFVPAEWLPALPARTRWRKLFEDGTTSLSNPAYAVLSQSKRFPLVWDALSTPLLTWQSLLPSTVSPRNRNLQEEGWVLKPALGHEGDDVAIGGVGGPGEWQRVCRLARKHPEAWAMQRRFQLDSLTTPEGPLYPCLGVYIIHGQVAGAYGRMAPRPLIDDRSRDVVVLVDR